MNSKINLFDPKAFIAQVPNSAYRGKMLVNGEPVEVSAGTIERVSPAHEVKVGIYPRADVAMVDKAIAAAIDTFESGTWSDISGKERSEVLFDIAAKIEARKDELALLDALESGKPLMQAKMEMDISVDLWRYAAGSARHLFGESFNNLGQNTMAQTQRVPVGPVSIIAP